MTKLGPARCSAVKITMTCRLLSVHLKHWRRAPTQKETTRTYTEKERRVPLFTALPPEDKSVPLWQWKNTKYNFERTVTFRFVNWTEAPIYPELICQGCQKKSARFIRTNRTRFWLISWHIFGQNSEWHLWMLRWVARRLHPVKTHGR